MGNHEWWWRDCKICKKEYEIGEGGSSDFDLCTKCNTPENIKIEKRLKEAHLIKVEEKNLEERRQALMLRKEKFQEEK